MLGGMVIGATLAMLLTPQSGPELRRQIKDFANDELDKAKAAARKAQGKRKKRSRRCAARPKANSRTYAHGKQTSGGRFLVALLAFALTAATGIVLLLTTLVVWLSALTGSLVTATLDRQRPLLPPRRRDLCAGAARADRPHTGSGRDGLRRGPRRQNGLRMALRKAATLSRRARGAAQGVIRKIRMPAGIRIFHASRSRKDGPHQLRNSTNTFV